VRYWRACGGGDVRRLMHALCGRWLAVVPYGTSIGGGKGHHM
jgi:hypothetical protein